MEPSEIRLTRPQAPAGPAPRASSAPTRWPGVGAAPLAAPPDRVPRSLRASGPLDEVSISRVQVGRGRCVLRAPGGPVDLDRYAVRGGSGVDQVERCVRAGV